MLRPVGGPWCCSVRCWRRPSSRVVCWRGRCRGSRRKRCRCWCRGVGRRSSVRLGLWRGRRGWCRRRMCPSGGTRGSCGFGCGRRWPCRSYGGRRGCRRGRSGSLGKRSPPLPSPRPMGVPGSGWTRGCGTCAGIGRVSGAGPRRHLERRLGRVVPGVRSPRRKGIPGFRLSVSHLGARAESAVSFPVGCSCLVGCSWSGRVGRCLRAGEGGSSSHVGGGSSSRVGAVRPRGGCLSVGSQGWGFVISMPVGRSSSPGLRLGWVGPWSSAGVAGRAFGGGAA